MHSVFPYRRDKRTRRRTWIIVSVLAVVGLFFALYSRSGYFPTWFLFFLATIALLLVLSIPRRIRLTQKTLEIHCVVELTSIALEDIVLIREMEPREMRWSFPLLASYGFFGYYGWFYNLSEWSLFKVYASQWRNFVRIEDIYETVYVVSCDDPKELIRSVSDLKKSSRPKPKRAPRRSKSTPRPDQTALDL